MLSMKTSEVNFGTNLQDLQQAALVCFVAHHCAVGWSFHSLHSCLSRCLCDNNLYKCCDCSVPYLRHIREGSRQMGLCLTASSGHEALGWAQSHRSHHLEEASCTNNCKRGKRCLRLRAAPGAGACARVQPLRTPLGGECVLVTAWVLSAHCQPQGQGRQEGEQATGTHLGLSWMFAMDCTVLHRPCPPCSSRTAQGLGGRRGAGARQASRRGCLLDLVLESAGSLHLLGINGDPPHIETVHKEQCWLRKTL